MKQDNGSTVSANELTRMVFENSHDAITVLLPVRDSEGIVVDFIHELVNPKAKSYFETDPTGKRVSTVFPGIENTDTFHQFIAVAGGNGSADIETVYDANGIQGWFRMYVVNAGVCIIVTTEDITQRKAAANAETALAKAEGKYMLLLANELRAKTRELEKITATMPDMVSIVELQTKKIRFIQSEQFHRHGFNLKEMEGATVDKMMLLLHLDDHVLLEHYFKRLETADDTETITTDYRAKRITGEWGWFQSRGKVFSRTKEGKPFEALNVVEDITEKKNATELLKKNFRQLQLLNKDLSTFTEVSTHGFKDPLKNIYTSVELLINAEAQKLSNTSRANFRRIQSAVQRMSLLTDDLLAFTRINSSHTDLLPLDLAEPLKKAIAEQQEKIIEKEFELITNVTHSANGDAKLVQQLFCLIIDNSVKFIQKNGVRKITIISDVIDADMVLSDESESKQHYVRVSFTDNGIGIPADEQSKVFELFYRALNAKNFKGTGVGLALVHKIMIAHEGSVVVDPSYQLGTRICCYFPI